MTKEDLDKIKTELSKLPGFSRLLLNLGTYPPPDSFVFEALFAYVTARSGLKFQYEINVNPDNDTTVDFVHEEIHKYTLYCELLSPDLSDTLRAATEPISTDMEGIKSWEVVLESNHPNEYLRPEAQTIRLQEKLLEKVEKFPAPAHN